MCQNAALRGNKLTITIPIIVDRKPDENTRKEERRPLTAIDNRQKTLTYNGNNSLTLMKIDISNMGNANNKSLYRK